MDQSTHQAYRILDGDETNFFAAEENNHSLDAATAAAVAQAVAPPPPNNVGAPPPAPPQHHHHHHQQHHQQHQHQHPLDAALNDGLLGAHVSPDISGVKQEASPTDPHLAVGNGISAPHQHHQHQPQPQHQHPHQLQQQQQHPTLPVNTTNQTNIGHEPHHDHPHAYHQPPQGHDQQPQHDPQLDPSLEGDADMANAQAQAQAIAATAINNPPAISTGNGNYFACPVRHCQFLGKKIPEIQRHMGRNQHKGINNRGLSNYDADLVFVPAALQNTVMIVDRDFKLAVCRNGSYILSKAEIPAHAKLCEMCAGFEPSLTDQPDYQEIAGQVNLDMFKKVQTLPEIGQEENYEAGMLRRVAGTYREDNEDNDKRFLCIYCYQDGKLFTMGRKDGNHLYNVHQVNPDNRAQAWVPCRGMSYRLLGKGFCDQSKFYVAVKSDTNAPQTQ